MDANGNPDAQPVTAADALGNRIDNLVVHPGDTLVTDRFDGDRYEFRLFDRDRHHVATIVTEPGPGLGNRITAIQWIGGRWAPVRLQPDTNSVTVKPDPNRFAGDPPVFTAEFSHFHRHPHTKPDDALTIDYWHIHDHTHPAIVRDPGPYGDHDGSAYLHDPGPGHGHDERGDDTKPGYPGYPGHPTSGAVGPSDPPWR